MITLETAGTFRGKAGTATAITYTLHGDEVGASDSFKTIAQGQLGSSTTTLYTVPGSTQTLIKQIHLANATGSDVTGIVFYVNGTAAANQITGTMKIVANGTATYTNGEWRFYDANGALIGTTIVAAFGVSYAGSPGLSATNVEAALDEIDTTMVHDSRRLQGVQPITVNTGFGFADLSADIDIGIRVSTTSEPGSMSAVDKGKLDAVHIDVTANTIAIVTAGGSATTNTTNLNSIFTSAPEGSIIFFPANTTKYDFNGAWNLANKRFTIMGAGPFQSQVNWSANVAGDLITIPSGHWYTQFHDMTFSCSGAADQSAGAVININGNVGINIINCTFVSAGKFFNNVLNYGGGNGSNSGNTTVVENCQLSGYKGTGIIVDASGSSIVVNNTVIQGQWGGTTSTPASAMATAGITGTFVGALQITNCDILGNINNLLLNPGAGAVNASVFCTNTYMDNSGGSCVKITGAGATVRARFDTCSFTTAGTNFTTVGTNLQAVEIASTFAYGVGGQGIDFVNCNVLNTFGTTGTSRGFSISGTADFSIGNCRIAGWPTAGIEVTPIGTAGRTQCQINNNTIGPAGGYGANGTGIILNAGAAAYGSMVVESNILDGNTTAGLTDNSAVMSGNVKSTASNPGYAGGVYVAGATQALTTVETVILAVPIPKGSLKVGTSFRLTMDYHPAATTVETVRIRIGTSAGTPATDTCVLSIADVTNTAGRTVTFIGAMSAVGGAATFIGNFKSTLDGATPTVTSSAITAGSGSFNSAADNFIMVTLQNTTSTTTTVYACVLEIFN